VRFKCTQRSVLVPGKDNRLGSVEACRAACLANAACTAWLYCWHPSGCDDGAANNPYWCHPHGTLPARHLPHSKLFKHLTIPCGLCTVVGKLHITLETTAEQMALQVANRWDI
jgi:hypothetical protein